MAQAVSIHCTVSFTTSSFKGITFSVRTGVVPGRYLYLIFLEENALKKEKIGKIIKGSCFCLASSTFKTTLTSHFHLKFEMVTCPINKMLKAIGSLMFNHADTMTD